MIDWSIHELTAGAAELHEMDLHPEDGHAAYFLVAAERALVLGSTQPDAHARGIDVVRRRSGGGAVLLAPGELTWLDLVVPRSSPLWHDDVGRAMHWVGDMWSRALADLGMVTTVHHGGLRHSPWSRTICFAGLGPGEVVDDLGRKVVGVSQRRTRAGARFQTVAYHRGRVSGIVDVVDLGATAEQAVAALDAETSVVPVDPEDLKAALLSHLPSSG